MSHNSNDINSPFWAMGNTNAIPYNLLFTTVDFESDSTQLDWIEFAQEPMLSRKEINISIRQLVHRYEKCIDEIFLNESPEFIIDYLKKALAQLNITVKKDSFRYYKSKLLRYEKFERNFPVKTLAILKERCFWYQRLNMFIFGVNKFGIGARYMFTLTRNLQELIKDKKLSYVTRKKLLVAYTFIFLNEKHRSVNYRDALDNIKSKFLKSKSRIRK